MQQIILIVHSLIALALIGIVLLQRSEGGGLGMSGGGGGFGGLMTGRGTANLLTRTTAILAALFFATSMILAILAGGHSKPASILDQAPQTSIPGAPPSAPFSAPDAGTAPRPPAVPAVPVAPPAAPAPSGAVAPPAAQPPAAPAPVAPAPPGPPAAPSAPVSQ
ncbi:MAG: preprotein translocase subunit SecG [Alphaproteobacteria bacterium]|nr:preprotein translocase subunit SecG [Alphaproteobacteria bacterium]